MEVLNTINSTFGIAFGTAACYGAGYIYGAICGVNKIMAASAFAIAIAVKLTFITLTQLIAGKKTGDAYDNPKSYYSARLAGDALFAIIHIIAFRQLNLMGHLGTLFFSFQGFIIALINLGDLKKTL